MAEYSFLIHENALKIANSVDFFFATAATNKNKLCGELQTSQI